MFEIVIFFGLFVAVMVCQMVFIWRNRGTPRVKAKADRRKDRRRDVINDPGMSWHPANNYHHDYSE